MGEVTLTSQGHNLEGGSSFRFSQTSDWINTDLLLAALADNGGRTETHLLKGGSQASDSGDDGACPRTDHRGVVRPHGRHSDIGAVAVRILRPD